MSDKRALVTGCTGQDGSFLCELLLEKGYEVHGVIRRSSSFNTGRIDHLYIDPHKQPRLHLHFGDMTDPLSLTRIVGEVQPDEVYNLAALSHVRVSFDQPLYAVETGAVGTLNLLEAIRLTVGCRNVRYYQASSSEMFGSTPPPQHEKTVFQPRSPYACGKVFSYYLTINYREAYQLFASNGILFNHESQRRGETFVTRKITRAVTRIKLGLQNKLYLGNLDAKRDWGYAPEYCEAMWMMLQHHSPDDFVVATGETHTVREFVQQAFEILDLDWKEYVEIDDRYMRPTEVDVLQGDPTKAISILGWQPRTKFATLVRFMVMEDMKLAQLERKLL